MRVMEINYERVHNLGNYESERIGIKVALDESEKAAEILPKIREFVSASRSGEHGTTQLAPPSPSQAVGNDNYPAAPSWQQA